MARKQKLPKKGDIIKGTFIRSTRSGDSKFRIGNNLFAIMNQSYSIWLSRPHINISLIKGVILDLQVKKVDYRKKSGEPHVVVGHLFTSEEPWVQAQQRHPIGSREAGRVVGFVYHIAILELDSRFYVWLYDNILSNIKSQKALDAFQHSTKLDILIIEHDQDKHRLIAKLQYLQSPPSVIEMAAQGESLSERDVSSPVEAIGKLSDAEISERNYPFETEATNLVEPSSRLIEGDSYQVELTVHERNLEARSQCIAHYGTRCVVCAFDFGVAYGPQAAGLIHVHHLNPLSEIGEAYEVNPITDLRPVCPNCHAVIHFGGRTLKIEEVKNLIAEAKQQAGDRKPRPNPSPHRPDPVRQHDPHQG